MSIDINEVIAQMIAAIKDEVKNDFGLVKSTVNDFMQRKKERLALLAELRLDNQVNDEDFQQRLQNEQLILESELHAIAIITKVTAQNAANAAIGVLNKAVTAAISL